MTSVLSIGLMADPLIGRVIQGYEFVERIGKGGFSQVFRVHSPRFDQDFCAKVITVEEEGVDAKWTSFQSEVAALKALDHPHIIRMYSHFREGNQFFLILEFCENGSLSAYLKTHQNIPEDQINTWIAQMLDAVAYCHSQGLAHRDIKPGNFLLDRFDRVRLADFGISLFTAASHEQNYVCSRTYAPPEILLKHQYDPMKADIWSLGVTIYAIIARCSPWPAEDTTHAILLANVTYGPQFPLVLKLLLKQMIIEDPNSRVTAQAAKKSVETMIITGKLPGTCPGAPTSAAPGQALRFAKRIRTTSSGKFNSSMVLHAGLQVSQGWRNGSLSSFRGLRRKSVTPSGELSLCAAAAVEAEKAGGQ